jgi:hypothetical protein
MKQWNAFISYASEIKKTKNDNGNQNLQTKRKHGN